MAQKRVLFVDDDAGVRMALRRVLGRLPIELTVVSTLADAFAWLDRGARPDLVISDLRLEDGSGLALLADAARRYPGVPCALHTGLASFTLEPLPGRALWVLAKPMDALDLLRQVELALGLPVTTEPAR